VPAIMQPAGIIVPMLLSTNTCMFPHVHPSIHPFLHRRPSIHPSIFTQTSIHPSIHFYTDVHPSIHPFLHRRPSIHPSIHPFILHKRLMHMINAHMHRIDEQRIALEVHQSRAWSRAWFKG